MAEKEPIEIHTGVCCECEASLSLSGSLMKGEITNCSDCGADLEITQVEGQTFQVALAPHELEDWGE